LPFPDIAALSICGTDGAHLNYDAADYTDLLPLLEPLDIENVADVLKEYGRNCTAADKEGGAQQPESRKRARDGGRPPASSS
jgi:hypothetical protein